MKVVFVHVDPWVSKSAGPGVATHACHALAKQGVQTHLIVPNYSKGPTEQVLAEDFGLAPEPRLRIHRIDTDKRWLFRIRAARIAGALCDPDTVLLTSWLYFLPCAYWLKQHRGCRVYFENHDFFWDPALRTDLKKRHRRRVWIERILFPRIDGLICVTEAQQQLYRERLRSDYPIAILRNGIPRFEICTPGPNLRLAYVGSLRWIKGVEDLQHLAKALPGTVQLSVIGARSATAQQELQNRFDALKADCDIRVLEWMSPSALDAELDHCHWGLVPLRDTFFNRHLTCPVKILTYYSHGMPVVASDLSAVRELVEDEVTGLLVDWRDGEAIAAKLQRLTQDYPQLQQAVKRRAEKLTWARRAEQMIRFLEIAAEPQA